jgi:hypothetical protein
MMDTGFRRPWILTPNGKWTSWLTLTVFNLVVITIVLSLWLDAHWWLRVAAIGALVLSGTVCVAIMAWLWWDLRPWKTEDDETKTHR